MCNSAESPRPLIQVEGFLLWNGTYFRLEMRLKQPTSFYAERSLLLRLIYRTQAIHAG